MATNFKDRPVPVFRNLLNYTLFAPAVQEGGKQARFTFSFMDARPRFTLFTNVATDEKKGIIGAGYYPEIFYGILDEFEQILTAEPGTSSNVRNFVAVRTEDGRPTGEKVVATQLTFGKDETGILYIQMAAQGFTKIRFRFTLSEYHLIYKKDKTPLTEEEASVLVAKNWLYGIRKACEIHSSQLAPEQADRSALTAKPETQKPSSSNEDLLGFDDIPL